MRGKESRELLTKADMHGNAHSALDGTANVVSVPRDTLRDIGVDTASKEKASCIFDVRILGRNEHDEPDDGRDVEANHEDASSLELVGSEAARDAQEARDNVGWHGHKLCRLVRVIESLHNSWQEEGEGI